MKNYVKVSIFSRLATIVQRAVNNGSAAELLLAHSITCALYIFELITNKEYSELKHMILSNLKKSEEAA